MSLVLLAAGAILAFWYSGHRPIARHNASLQAAIGKASRVEITVTPRYGEDGLELPAKPPVVITDRTEIDRMLSHFKLPLHLRATGLFHECGGHLRLRIVMPDSTEHGLRYDHGNGIYPIAKTNELPGFCHLPKNACAFLNGYFASLGYSADDLGIGE
jgi:hypothetical protein